MSAADLLEHATTIGLVLLLLAAVLTVVRLVLGPTLADRILALDVLTTLAIGMIAAFAIRTSFALYLDIAISLGLLGFLSTVAFARYLLRRAEEGEGKQEEEVTE